ncbi:MAG: PilZ domain-containing protein [Halioglobus sp.]
MGKEKRQWLRLPMSVRTFIELESPEFGSDQTPHLITCNTVTVSRGGLRVAVNEAFEVESILQIGIEAPGDFATLYLTGEVVWCNPSEEVPPKYNVGFRLLNNSDSDISRWFSLLAGLDS